VRIQAVFFPSATLIGVLIDAARRIRDIPIGALAFTAFGISMMLTAVFSHRPIDLNLFYNQLHDFLHSVFSGS